MSKKVIISLANGSVEIATMDTNWKIKQIADSSKPEIIDFETALEEYRLVVDSSGTNSRITDTTNLPQDRTFRDAWTDDLPGEQIDVDIPRAKIIRMEQIRAARDVKWEDFDKRYVIAERDAADLTTLDTERQTLKDIPQVAQSDVDTATTESDLLAVWPTGLD